MVSPIPKLLLSESVPAAPDRHVAPVTGQGIVAWLLARPPAAVVVLGPIRSGGVTAVAVPLKPSAANAVVFELETDRPAASSVWIEITPPLMVEGVDVPVIESIFDSSVWILSVTLT